jgi:hypothetical protein
MKNCLPAWIRTTVTITNTECVSCRALKGLKCRNGPEKPPLVHNSYTEFVSTRLRFRRSRLPHSSTDLKYEAILRRGAPIDAIDLFSNDELGPIGIFRVIRTCARLPNSTQALRSSTGFERGLRVIHSRPTVIR